ncbi:hypothetical protein GALL_123540 [mine drainage metagenome]|uniref:Membrane protein YqjE n=1 Tax=mine drainage metagenome TaxID=410659 RepID=A0A1J5SBL6_9ZZZZ
MPQSTGLMESLKRMTSTLLAIIQTRIELLGNEIEEERLRVRQMLFYGSVALFFLGMTIMLLTVFVVVVFWDSYRLQVLGGLTLLFLVAGLSFWYALRSIARARPRLFSTTLSELSDDIDRLNPRP